MTDAPTEWDTLTDPSQTFTVEVPRGWQHQVQMVPTPATKHTLVAATSPDGATKLFTGDVDLPMFIEPQAVTFGVPPGMVVRPGTPAAQLLPEFGQYRFGPGFRAAGIAECPSALEPVAEAARRNGMPLAWATSARLGFEVPGSDSRGVLVMATFSVGGGLWFAQLHGVTSTADPEPFVPALLRMAGSVLSTPAERQRLAQERMLSAAQHQATMANIAANTAMMASNHAQNMANIQMSAQAHQARMANLHAGYDAQAAAWAAQQSSSDAAQRDVVNTIREERTVVDADGYTHQVQAGYDRYFYRRYDGTMVGLQQHQQLTDLGLDPALYEEVRIQS